MTKGIYKRGKIYWIRYARLDGKMCFESTHTDKYKIAEGLHSKRKQEIREGKQPEPIKKINNVLFKDAVKEYLAFVKRQRSYESKKYCQIRSIRTLNPVLSERSSGDSPPAVSTL